MVFALSHRNDLRKAHLSGQESAPSDSAIFGTALVFGAAFLGHLSDSSADIDCVYRAHFAGRNSITEAKDVLISKK